MKLALGTVQLGTAYGISNRDGQVPREEARAILELAWAKGIRCLDTAPAYGAAEEVLGAVIPADHAFEIVTKTKSGQTDVATALSESLARLKRDSVYGLLDHNAAGLLGHDSDSFYASLRRLKDEGRVRKIGASVYTASQIDQLLSRYRLDLIQLPFNLLDQRLAASGHLKRLKDAGVEIHARSVFLQGLLLMNPAELPLEFDSVRGHLASVEKGLVTAGLSMLEGAAAFVASRPEIDRVLVGVCSRRELAEIAAAVAKTPPQVDWARFAWDDERILNPALWVRR